MDEPKYEWDWWLKQWNQALIERLDPDEYQYYEPTVIQAVHSNWLGNLGATQEQILSLEQRLKIHLPPSYRQFLIASNGFQQPGMLVPRLYRVEDVEWFRVRNQGTIDAWLNYGMPPVEEVKEADPDYFVQFFPFMLEISAKEASGSTRYLLNPKRVREDGEWEAYYYANVRLETTLLFELRTTGTSAVVQVRHD